MLDFIRKYLIKRLRKNLKPVSMGKFGSLGQINSVSFAMYIETDSNVKELIEIISILDKTDIPFKGLVLDCNNLVSSEISHNNNLLVLLKNNINWLGIPQKESIKDFTQDNSDIFICFNSCNYFTLDYICSLKESPFKVALGDVQATELYTMILKNSKKNHADNPSMLNSLLEYLKTINSSKVDD